MPQVILERGGRTANAQGQTPDLRVPCIHSPSRLIDRIWWSSFVRPYSNTAGLFVIVVGHLVSSRGPAHA